MASRTSGKRAGSERPVSLIVGLGRTGVSCVRHLAARGHEIRVTDSRAAPPGLAELGRLAPEVKPALGGFDSSLLHGADQVVVSPGISLREPIIRAAEEQGIDVLGDIEIFAREVSGRTVAITGTNGKSTVTTLLGEMAEAGHVDVKVGGNIGRPALELLAGEPAELYVLELSSFQLETTRSLALEAATVLNLSADHLDRYADLAEYGAAKARIYDRCGTAVVNLDDALVRGMPRPGQRAVTFSLVQQDADYSLLPEPGGDWLAAGGQPLLPLRELRISGRHNAANALAALALADACGIPRAAALAGLSRFTGLPHRAQFVAQTDGVRWIDDSKATNVGSTLAAVAGLEGPLLLIAGGDGKGQDFAPLAAAFHGKVRRVIVLGRDAGRVAQALQGTCDVEQVADMEAAVAAARRAAQPGDTVLLSPACSSLDMFRDYAHRGEVFATAVRRLVA